MRNYNKILISVLSILMVLTLAIPSFIIDVYADNTIDTWDGTSVATGYQSGSGTSGDPYNIATCAQLAYLRSRVNSGNVAYGTYFTLASSVTFDLHGYVWTPIGDRKSVV